MLQAILEPGMNVLDIGANIGYYAIMESILVGTSGNVVAIEPMLPNIKMLRKNIELNNLTDSITLLQKKSRGHNLEPI